MDSAAIVASDLVKRFGDVPALDGIDFFVPPGTVFGLLGPNGAGKTTTVRILTTIIRPDAGEARVLGHDVVTEAGAVRNVIGLAGQYAAVDENLTGAENLRMVGKLTHLPRALIRERSVELLERFELTAAANRPVKTYSGGMRRRLDLAASLVHRPQVLFLDEPTTGLDPRSRNELWDMLRDLTRGGTTIVLTTQYLEEADLLADEVVVLDHGLTVAHGTPAELKTRIGTDRVEVTLASRDEIDGLTRATTAFATSAPTFDPDLLVATVPVVEGTRLMDVMRALDASGVDAVDLNRREASLDDVFLMLTGSTGHDDELITDDDPAEVRA